MKDRADTLAEIAMLILGTVIGAVGAALVADNKELLGLVFLLVGLSVGISGALAIILKALYSAAYTGIFVTIFYDKIAMAFEAHGPDWWAYFWWVPVLVVLCILLFAFSVFLDS